MHLRKVDNWRRFSSIRKAAERAFQKTAPCMEMDCRSTMGTWPKKYDQQLLGASTSLATVDMDEVVAEQIAAPTCETSVDE